MKKFFLVLWLMMAIGLAACSGGKETLRNEKKGGVEVGRNLLQGVVGYDRTKPLYFSTEVDNWLKDGKLTENVDQVRDNGKGSYVVARGMAGQSFQLFQVEENEDGQVKKVLWLADITAEPKLYLRTAMDQTTATEDTAAVKPSGRRTVTGQGNGNQVIGFWVKAQKMNENFDDYGNVDAREALNTRYVISWDVDALGHTDEIRQYDFGNQDGHGPHIVAVDPSANDAVVDIRRGKQLMLYSQNVPAMIINHLKSGDLHLVNLDKVRYDSEDYLEIIPPPMVKLKTLDNMLKDQQSFNYSGKVRRVNWDNYRDGFIRFNSNDLLAKVKRGDCDHMVFYRELVRNGAIGEEDQGPTVVGKTWMKKNFPVLYEQYKDEIKYP